MYLNMYKVKQYLSTAFQPFLQTGVCYLRSRTWDCWAGDFLHCIPLQTLLYHTLGVFWAFRQGLFVLLAPTSRFNSARFTTKANSPLHSQA